jgi:hypothetical protein
VAEPQFKKLTTKEFVMHVSTQMLRRSLDQVESILPQASLPSHPPFSFTVHCLSAPSPHSHHVNTSHMLLTLPS